MEREYFNYKGTFFPNVSTSMEDLNFVENEFQVRDDDVFNVTYPKSGTTWMLEILSLIKTNGDPTLCRTVPNWQRLPWIESHGIAKGQQENKEKSRYFDTHLPIHLFMKSFLNSKAKIIYTVRNPKDVIVSHYYFGKMSIFFNDFENFDELLKEFLWSKEVPYGSWFDHVKGWTDLMGNSNFMLNTYEDMQKDIRGSVKRICKFIGKELDDAAMDSVIENASFRSMKENNMSNYKTVPTELMNQSTGEFIRKGICGDWKNHFTEAQTKCFDKIYKERMENCKVKFPWDAE
ncbi:sulfotransferase 2B1-like isoform 1-T2 [Mantella aurantiaca]